MTLATDDLAPVLIRAVEILRAMAYEHRLHILIVLQDGEHTPAALGAKVPAEATAIAHHLRFLLDARLVQRRRRGRYVFYSLSDQDTRFLIMEVLRLSE